MTNVNIEEGSTSSDSCIIDDIVSGVAKLLSDELLTEYNGATQEDRLYIFDDIFGYLNDVAPDGLFFGAHHGDGACYGFWRIE